MQRLSKNAIPIPTNMHAMQTQQSYIQESVNIQYFHSVPHGRIGVYSFAMICVKRLRRWWSASLVIDETLKFSNKLHIPLSYVVYYFKLPNLLSLLFIISVFYPFICWKSQLKESPIFKCQTLSGCKSSITVISADIEWWVLSRTAFETKWHFMLHSDDHISMFT